MAKTECPSCESLIPVARKPRMGDLVICPVCKEKLEIIWLNPIELDWPMDDYEDYDEYDEPEYAKDNGRN